MKTKYIKSVTILLFACYAVFTARQLRAAQHGDEYFAANSLFNKKMYKLAVEEYKNFMLKNPQHPKFLSAKLGLALSYFELRNFREAGAIFKELADDAAAPKQDQIHNLLGQCYLIHGKPDKAELAFRWSVNHGKEKYFLELPGVGHSTSQTPSISMPTDTEPLERSLAGLTEALYQQQKWKETIKAAADLRKLVPNGAYTPRTMFLGALAHYKLKQYKNAAKILQKLVTDANFPYRENAYFLLGDCQQQLGKIDNAIKNMDIVARQLKGKLAPEAVFRLGYIKFMQKEYHAAINDFSDLRALYSGNKLAPRAGVYLGRCYLELKLYRKAQAVFGSLTDRGTVRAEATLWLSETFLRQKKFTAAIDILRPSLKIFAKDKLLPNLIFNYATAMMGLKQYEKAADQFAKVISNFKEFTLTADAVRMNAFALNQAKKYQESIEQCNNFLKQFPQNPESRDVSFLKAENLYFLNKYKEAIKQYRLFIPWDGKEKYTDESRYRIACILSEMKKWDDALVELKPLLQEGVKGDFFEQIHFVAGLCEYNTDDLDTAVKDFLKFAADYPTKQNADTALIKAGMAYIKLNERKEAVNVLKKLIATYPRSTHLPQALTELGKLLFFKEKNKEAKNVLNRVVTEYPKSRFVPEAEYFLGFIAMKLNKKEAALEHFENSIKNDPKSPFAPDALFQEGMIYIESENYPAAQKKLKLFLDMYQNDPKSEKAQFYYAVTLSRQKKYDDSTSVFKQFIQNHPRSPMVQRALYEAAWRARELHQVNKARENYNALLKEYPLGKLAERATFELAELEYEAKKYNRAIALLDRLLAKGVDEKMEERIYYRLAWCFLGRKQDDDALDAFEKLLKKYPQSDYTPVAAYQAGELRLKMHDYENAYNYYLQSVSSKKKSVVREMALLRLGEAQTLRDTWGAAQKTFEMFMAEFPKSKFVRRAQLMRGWCLENQKKYKPAINDYNAVLRLAIVDAVSARAQFQIGECYMALKKYPEAIKALILLETRYGKFKEWTSKAILEIGQAMDRMGKKKQAVEQYKKVKKLYPGTPEASVADELLRQHKIYSVD